MGAERAGHLLWVGYLRAVHKYKALVFFWTGAYGSFPLMSSLHGALFATVARGGSYVED